MVLQGRAFLLRVGRIGRQEGGEHSLSKGRCGVKHTQVTVKVKVKVNVSRLSRQVGLTQRGGEGRPTRRQQAGREAFTGTAKEGRESLVAGK